MSTITQEQLQAAYTQWTTDLNLTDEQKEKFHAAVDKTVAKPTRRRPTARRLTPTRPRRPSAWPWRSG